jgi:hypothetical protein
MFIISAHGSLAELKRQVMSVQDSRHKPLSLQPQLGQPEIAYQLSMWVAQRVVHQVGQMLASCCLVMSLADRQNTAKACQDFQMVVTDFQPDHPERVAAIQVIGFFQLLKLCNLKLRNAGKKHVSRCWTTGQGFHNG